MTAWLSQFYYGKKICTVAGTRECVDKDNALVHYSSLAIAKSVLLACERKEKKTLCLKNLFLQQAGQVCLAADHVSTRMGMHVWGFYCIDRYH